MDAVAAARFVWHTYDVASVLPAGWRADILSLVDQRLKTTVIRAVSSTSRESETDVDIPIHTVDAEVVARCLPWLTDLYAGLFRDLAGRLVGEPVVVSAEAFRGPRIQVQRGTADWYEAHVDTCPITGLLYVTDQPEGAGGELVVANAGDVEGRQEVDRDAALIRPAAGQIVYFDGRRRTHMCGP